MEKTRHTVLIGSYTEPGAPGVRRVAVDSATGEMRACAPAAPDAGNPIYFALAPGGRRLYVAQASAPDADRATAGALAAYTLDAGGAATRIDLLPLPYSVPCHISLTPGGGHLLYAEYSGAHAGAVALRADGTFGDRSEVHHEGSGPNLKRQASAHCHCAVAAPDGAGVFVCDLGTDTVNAYAVAAAPSAALEPSPERDFHAPPGSGPRHLVFNGAGDRAYLIYELGNAVQAFSYAGGRLTPLQAPLSTLPAGFGGETKCAAIRLSPDGKWLLASNRGHDSIAAFRILADGTLDGSPAISALDGRFPRDFIFLAGDCVMAGHKLSDTVGLYRFDAATGALRRIGVPYAMPRPLAFAALK